MLKPRGLLPNHEHTWKWRYAVQVWARRHAGSGSGFEAAVQAAIVFWFFAELGRIFAEGLK